jgi:hypothetical protein
MGTYLLRQLELRISGENENDTRLEARRPIAKLERQTKKAKDSNSPPQLDQLAISARSGSPSRGSGRRGQKLEWAGHAFGKCSGAVASAGRALDKIEVMLEEIESEWANVPKRSAAPNVIHLGWALNLRRIVCFSLRPLPLLRQGVAALAY